jgi:hypothetical protein
MPPIIGKKHSSDDQDSDGMGPSSKPTAPPKQKKRKKNMIKQLDQEDIGKFVGNVFRNGNCSEEEYIIKETNECRYNKKGSYLTSTTTNSSSC